MNLKSWMILIGTAFFSVGSMQARIVFSSIDTPGFYKLADNLTNSVTITVSDVTFDLGGHTIAASNGIIINSNLNQICIKNGAIDASVDGIIANSGCTNITLENITTKNATRGINFENVTDGVIKNCEMTTNTTGLELDNSHNIVIDSSVANCNTHAGYCLLSSTTCLIQNCQALSTGEGNVDIEGTTVFGFVSRDGYGNVFERCIANSTQALTVTDSSSLIAGFAFRGTEKCSKIIDSEAANSTTDPEEFTVPYGILLEGTIESTQSVAGDLVGTIRSVNWSPDGQYVVLGGQAIAAGEQLQLYKFERVAEALTNVASALPEGGTNIFGVDWSPSGQYIAIAGNALTGGSGDEFQIFSFDRAAGILTSVTGVLAGVGLSINWSPDEEYIALGGQVLAGDEFQVYKFDRVAETLTSVATALAGTILTVKWSPDGQYIAIGGDGITGGTGDQFQIFKFDRATGILTNVTGALSGDVNSVNWSPDGQYIAIGGDGITGGTGDQFQIFKFDRSAGTLTSVAGALSGTINGVNWSADGQYVLLGGLITGGTGNAVQIFRFDRAAGTVTSVAGALSGTVNDVNWSPDGQFAAMVGVSVSGNEFQILDGLQFPEKNVIKNNTVYCNSGNQFPGGVGISGSSIANMIIGNTSYSNPIPRGENAPIVSSNYEFVTNIFNPLFEIAPSDIENISLAGCEPICPPDDISARIDRVEKLFESLIDNLL